MYETIWHHIPEQGHLHNHKSDCRLDCTSSNSSRM